MRYLLAAINAKYIHSNLGIYSLRRYAMERLGLGQKDEQGAAVGMEMVSEAAEGANRTKTVSEIQIDLGEYTINHQMDQILQDIYRRKPDVVGFSCYIWNIVYVKELIHDLKKVLPQVRIWMGGPEASYDAVHLMDELPEVELIMQGEGEETFTRLVEACECRDGWFVFQSFQALSYAVRWHHRGPSSGAAHESGRHSIFLRRFKRAGTPHYLL